MNHRHILYTICSILSLLPISLSANIKAVHTYSQPFVEATQKVIPSVVSIKVRLKKSHRQWQQQHEERSLHEDFWERFFGTSPFEHRQTPQKPRYAYGSGFIVSSDGYILTNNHIAEEADVLTVQLQNGKEYTAEKVGIDPSTDIALLKIEETDLPMLKFADTSEVEVGEWALAIGNPLGLQASVSAGIVSAKGRADLDIVRIESFIQTDAAINMGNSGGPLVNLNGEVIGMNTVIVTNTGGNMGIGFAVPSTFLQKVMEELIEHGELSRGFLGVALQHVDSDIAAAVGLERVYGALVAEVVEDGPADKAGITSGDIIIEVEGTAVETLGSFRNVVAFAKPGQEISLKIRRNEEEILITATVGDHPDNGHTTTSLEESIGISIEPVTPELVTKHKLETTTGLLIVQIDPDSLAYHAGLRAGHVILAINGQSVTTVQDFSQAIKNAKKGKRLLLQLKVGTNIRFVPLVIE
jgi:serine protease Do